MNSFYEHHKDSIRFHYRCFERILLNGLIQPFQQPEIRGARSDRALRLSHREGVAVAHRRLGRH